MRKGESLILYEKPNKLILHKKTKPLISRISKTSKTPKIPQKHSEKPKYAQGPPEMPTMARQTFNVL